MAHPDPVDHGDTGRGPENFDPVDNLLGDDPDETMQTGYSPPDREPRSLRRAPTLEEQREGVTVAGYLEQEEPEIDHLDVISGEPEPRAGRLVSPGEPLDHRDVPDGVAEDVGPAGYASSAEEAAMYVTEPAGAEVHPLGEYVEPAAELDEPGFGDDDDLGARHDV